MARQLPLFTGCMEWEEERILAPMILIYSPRSRDNRRSCSRPFVQHRLKKQQQGKEKIESQKAMNTFLSKGDYYTSPLHPSQPQSAKCPLRGNSGYATVRRMGRCCVPLFPRSCRPPPHPVVQRHGSRSGWVLFTPPSQGTAGPLHQHIIFRYGTVATHYRANRSGSSERPRDTSLRCRTPARPLDAAF
jgi:hypothetical protein